MQLLQKVFLRNADCHLNIMDAYPNRKIEKKNRKIEKRTPFAEGADGTCFGTTSGGNPILVRCNSQESSWRLDYTFRDVYMIKFVITSTMHMQISILVNYTTCRERETEGGVGLCVRER